LLYRRHILKTISWRLVATSDTIILSYFFTNSLTIGFSIGLIEVLTKSALYFIHERFWFKFGIRNSFFRHIFKTFSWRIIGTIDTVVISLILTERIDIAFKIGFFEIITKMILYYCHEKLWYTSKFGLNG